MTRKYFYRVTLFIEKYADVSLEIDWRLTVHTFCLVLYLNSVNEVLRKLIRDIMDRWCTEDWKFSEFIGYQFYYYSYV